MKIFCAFKIFQNLITIRSLLWEVNSFKNLAVADKKTDEMGQQSLASARHKIALQEKQSTLLFQLNGATINPMN